MKTLQDLRARINALYKSLDSGAMLTPDEKQKIYELLEELQSQEDIAFEFAVRRVVRDEMNQRASKLSGDW